MQCQDRYCHVWPAAWAYRETGTSKEIWGTLVARRFELESPKTGDWKVGVRPVLTRLWGERVVYAIVTLPKSGNGSRRLFFCTKAPESIILDYSKCEDDTIRGYGEENNQFLPLACYSPRWNIEVSYYESKTFWSLEEYRVRSREGIGRLVNLECISGCPYAFGKTAIFCFFPAISHKNKILPLISEHLFVIMLMRWRSATKTTIPICQSHIKHNLILLSGFL